MRIDRSIAGRDINPFGPAAGDRGIADPHRRARAQTALLEVLVFVALVALELAAASAVAAIFAPIAWPFS